MYRPVHFYSSAAKEWERSEKLESTPGARDLAVQIANELAIGAAEVGPIDQHESYGWEFYSRIGDSSYYHVLHPLDGEATLTTSMSFYRLKALMIKRPRNSFDECCSRIGAALTAIPTVSRIEWGDYFA